MQYLTPTVTQLFSSWQMQKKISQNDEKPIEKNSRFSTKKQAFRTYFVLMFSPCLTSRMFSGTNSLVWENNRRLATSQRESPVTEVISPTKKPNALHLFGDFISSKHQALYEVFGRNKIEMVDIKKLLLRFDPPVQACGITQVFVMFLGMGCRRSLKSIITYHQQILLKRLMNYWLNKHI